MRSDPAATGSTGRLLVRYLASRALPERVSLPRFVAAVRELVDLELESGGADWPLERQLAWWRGADVALTDRESAALPLALAAERGRLRYVCHLTGTLQAVIPLELIQAGLVVTNWGDAPAENVAEGALALLLAVLKDLPWRTAQVRAEGWTPPAHRTGTLVGLRVGLYGFGYIGRAFLRRIAALGARPILFDPYAADLPPEVEVVPRLEDLFARSDAVSLHAGLNDTTRGSVTRHCLSLLPDGGIVINTARGALIDQAALFDELRSGRLRAGLDVLDGDDRLPPGHEARQWPNLILTTHTIATLRWPPAGDRLSSAHEVALDNLRRYVARQPLRFRFDERTWRLST